jgi:hypothetical protein
VSWTFAGPIPDATICNCTACRRYGVLWAYDYDGHAIHVQAAPGQVVAFKRRADSPLTFNFCKTCGNLISWRGTRADAEGRTRIAVNLRLAEPEAVAAIPLLRFDGLHSFEDLPPDGRSVGALWF